MEKLKLGQIVKSKAGRDKDRLFVIFEVKDEYVYLVDGDLRKLENPKKKKMKHIQGTNYIVNDLQEKIINDQKILNSEIRNTIQLFQKEDN
ncbi:ribosomal protein L14E/L6E/L27E [Natranaerovirga hydrolytica]|uniref:Ribosomal protein L14E/L6E/L27E n=1 Tax=Natranaerovirga hydrolytica TaxID=680378 RepID=A0A4R1MLF4_9FIRM|nr:KOW domain-containing RNA-binding protein [Natranaerovirga hydrolytica]TCK93437.1 ribosomal protein L14E/L6E/L27E [Natranaerovirga hydrolytica]